MEACVKEPIVMLEAAALAKDREMLYVSAHHQVEEAKEFPAERTEFNSNSDEARDLIDIQAINRKKLLLEEQLRLAAVKPPVEEEEKQLRFEELRPEDAVDSEGKQEEEPEDVTKDSIYPNLVVHDHPQAPTVEFFDRNPFVQKSMFINDNYF